MRIKTADSWLLRVPVPADHRDFEDAEIELVGLTLRTDSDHEGVGFAYTAYYGGAEGVKALLDSMVIPGLVGSDPDDYLKVWHDLEHRTRRLGRGVAMLAISAADIALWDLRARIREVPLSVLLGRLHDRVPLYGSGKGSPLLSDEELVRNCVEFIDRGFRAVKLRVGTDLHRDLRRVAAVRRALGDEVHIMCDANERLDLLNAAWLGERLANEGVYWFEEPIRSNHAAAFRTLSERVRVPLAVGEHLQTRWEFVPFISDRSVAVLQPNATTTGGITELVRIAHLADAHEIPIAPHFLTEVHIHPFSAMPNGCFLEYFPFLEDLVEEPLRVEDGHAVVPDSPGLGLTFREATWERYRVA